MKEEIDRIPAQDKKLQKFLAWVEQKACSVDASYQPAAIRAFYFALAHDFYFALALASDLDPALASDLDPGFDLAYDLDLDFTRARVLALDFVLARDFASSRDLARDLARPRAFDPKLQQKLQKLNNQLPSIDNWEGYKQWWKTNGQAWTERLRTVMIQYRNVGHDWQFTQAQKEFLQQYYDANKLLVDCLNSDCYVSREVRNKIEATLLLPYDRTRQPSEP